MCAGNDKSGLTALLPLSQKNAQAKLFDPVWIVVVIARSARYAGAAAERAEAQQLMKIPFNCLCIAYFLSSATAPSNSARVARVTRVQHSLSSFLNFHLVPSIPVAAKLELQCAAALRKPTAVQQI